MTNVYNKVFDKCRLRQKSIGSLMQNEQIMTHRRNLERKKEGNIKPERFRRTSVS